LIPSGKLVTVPPSLLFTVRVERVDEKFAVTDFAASIVSVHVVPVPVHAPLQPVKEYPDAAVAVSVTDAERGKP
jgi:hypothetical protein